MANLKDLIVNGASRLIGMVSINSSTIGVINNSTVGDNPKFTDTTYTTVGTSGNAGLMSTADKVKLDTIATSATRNTFSTFAGAPTSNQTPGFGSTFNIYQVGQTTAGAITTTARTVKIPNTAATTAAAGLMSATDKINLNTAYAHSTKIGAQTATTELGLRKIQINNEGHIISSTVVSKNDITALGIPSQNTTYGLATTASSGLLRTLVTSSSNYLDGTGNWNIPTNTTTYAGIFGSGFNSFKWDLDAPDYNYQTCFLGTVMNSISNEIRGSLMLYGGMTTATNSSTHSIIASIQKLTYTNSYGTLVDDQPTLILYQDGGPNASWLSSNRGYIQNGSFGGFMVYGKTPQHSYNMDWTSNGLIMYVDTTNVGKITLTSSDARAKTDINPLGEQYKKAISSLDFKEFKYNFKDPVRSEANGLKRFGVIAQDVIAALEKQGLDWEQSEIVETTENEDDTYYTINYVPFLVTRLAADEDRIKQLEETVKNLTTRLEALEHK